MRNFIALATVIPIIILFTLWPIRLIGSAEKYEIVKADEKVQLVKELIPVCACESVGRKDAEPRQFDDKGNVVVGLINPNDIGMCQINVVVS